MLDPDVKAVDDHKGSEVLNPSNAAGSEQLNPLVDRINPKTSLLYWSPDRFHLSPEGYDLLGTYSSYFHHDIVLIINNHRITTWPISSFTVLSSLSSSTSSSHASHIIFINIIAIIIVIIILIIIIIIIIMNIIITIITIFVIPIIIIINIFLCLGSMIYNKMIEFLSERSIISAQHPKLSKEEERSVCTWPVSRW